MLTKQQVYQALADGKELQHTSQNGWVTFLPYLDPVDTNSFCYRIKPKTVVKTIAYPAPELKVTDDTFFVEFEIFQTKGASAHKVDEALGSGRVFKDIKDAETYIEQLNKDHEHC